MGRCWRKRERRWSELERLDAAWSISAGDPSPPVGVFPGAPHLQSLPSGALHLDPPLDSLRESGAWLPALSSYLWRVSG